MDHFLGSELAMDRDGATSIRIFGKVDQSYPVTILFVEDEAFVREVTREILESEGYRVLTAGSAAEAQRIYNERGTEVDLLLTDVILPGESGRVLAARVRRENAALKVLYVTGYPEQMVMRATENEDCLAKPFSADALLDRVRQLLDPADVLAMRACACV
ncbi:MAG TPA: response regulator [Candidatus Dormibacteraeota bacterium]|nr:response regulator [Candidatus Dormibacteraeota bacterium]